MASDMTYPHSPPFSTWSDSPQTVHNESTLAFMSTRHPYARAPAPRQPQKEPDRRVWHPQTALSSNEDAGGSQSQAIPHQHTPPLSSPPSLLRRSLIDDPAFSMDPSSNPHFRQPHYPPPPLPPHQLTFFPVQGSIISHSHSHMLPSSEGTLPQDHIEHSESMPNHRLKSPPVADLKASTDPTTILPFPNMPSSSTAKSSLSSHLVNVSISSSSSNPSSHSSHESTEYPEMSRSSIDTPPGLPTPPTRSYSRHRKPPPTYEETVESEGGPSAMHDLPLLADSKPPPIVLSYERPKQKQRRTSSIPSPVDLDRIDELDETDPMGLGYHHKGPYDLIAAAIGQNLTTGVPQELRVKKDTGQVRQESDGGEASGPKSSRRHKHEPDSLENLVPIGLKPGQIVPKSFFNSQPSVPTFPLERSPATYPADHYLQPPNAALYGQSGSGYTSTTAPPSPLRRNFTLPMSQAQAERSHHVPPPNPQQFSFDSTSAPGSRPVPLNYPPPPFARTNIQEGPFVVSPPAPQSHSRAAPVYHPGPAEYLPVPGIPFAIAPSPSPSPKPLRSNTAPPEHWRPLPENGYNRPHLNNLEQHEISLASRRQAISNIPPRISSHYISQPRQREPAPLIPVQAQENIPPQQHARSAPFTVPEPDLSSRAARRQASHIAAPAHPRGVAALPTVQNSGPLHRYLPPSEMVAALKEADYPLPGGPPPDINFPPPSIMSSSSQQSSLSPRHIPRHLVMPAPLSPPPESLDASFDPYALADKRQVRNARVEVRFEQQPQPPRSHATLMAQSGGKNLLRKRSAPANMSQPRSPAQPQDPRQATSPIPRRQQSAPAHHGGMLSLFGFGKDKRTEVRDVGGPREVGDTHLKTEGRRAPRKLSRRR
ncbi:hypothetical protein EW146_g7879 [Bondarzewia mesenterica]|uniref:Uncharacterized protein n=1 Tax=Bondarzewia mesenterica TaxID=1095465 RepID=A0A4S4LP66_9AGAM|nr:hypothetical protein EW146_g7879 [Bondarzewia mesenterica]